MRLIDANKLIKLINEQKEKETGAYTKGVNNGLNIAKSIVNDKKQTPTAYDVDKVVKELEVYPHGNLGVQEIGEIIEIVKQGGVSDDVCEWKEDAYGRWHTDCHYLADNEPLEYTYCPYCGKKIKVVDNDK